MKDYSPDIEKLRIEFGYFNREFTYFKPAFYYSNEMFEKPFQIIDELYRPVEILSIKYNADINDLLWLLDRFILPPKMINPLNKIVSASVSELRDQKKLYDAYKAGYDISINYFDGKKTKKIENSTSRNILRKWIDKTEFLQSELLEKDLKTRKFPSAANQYLVFLIESMLNYFRKVDAKKSERQWYFMIGSLLYYKEWYFKDTSGITLNNPDTITSSSTSPFEDQITRLVKKTKKY